VPIIDMRIKFSLTNVTYNELTWSSSSTSHIA